MQDKLTSNYIYLKCQRTTNFWNSNSQCSDCHCSHWRKRHFNSIAVTQTFTFINRQPQHSAVCAVLYTLQPTTKTWIQSWINVKLHIKILNTNQQTIHTYKSTTNWSYLTRQYAYHHTQLTIVCCLPSAYLYTYTTTTNTATALISSDTQSYVRTAFFLIFLITTYLPIYLSMYCWSFLAFIKHHPVLRCPALP